jgi:triosephosphate isomerase
MRRKLVIGNWKMHGSRQSVDALVKSLVESLAAPGSEVALCPPFVHIGRVSDLVEGSVIAVGAQDCSAFESGAHTGEVSAPMLREAGCEMVIVGHSERRAQHGETDELVADKAVAARGSGLVPVMCVGETLEERERGEAEQVVGRQLDALIGSSLEAGDVIAYEPVWAIGTGQTATPGQAGDMHGFIRARLRQSSATVAESIRLLYGGSVKAANAVELFAQPDIDGGLVGGASLDAGEFTAIVAAAD